MKKESKNKSMFLVACIISLAIILAVITAGCNKGISGITGNIVNEGTKASEETTEAEEQEEPKILAPNQLCTDSDGGDEPTVLGKAVLIKNKTKIISEDACVGNELKERYCDGNEEKIKRYDCKNGCDGGRCILNKREEIDSQYDSLGAPVIVSYAPPVDETPKEEPVEPEEQMNTFYNCVNGFKDSFETDVDCGGQCSTKCSYGKMCKKNDDCAPELRCNTRMKKCMQRAY